jgi:formamidopyrimidine-DNA glycosylase
MIELPEAVVIAAQAERTLAGRRIARAVANQSPHKFAWYSGTPADYASWLEGRVLGPAQAFGGQIEIPAGERTLVLTTPLRYHRPGEARPPKHQLLLEFDDGSALSCTVVMWGGMLCLLPDEKPSLGDVTTARTKPSPLSAAFDRAYFDGLYDETCAPLSAKAFLATEQRIPGLGNGVLQDILWTARIHPRRKMAELPPLALAAMFDAVKSVLAAMAAQSGRDTERDLYGQPGGYRTVLSKNTVGQPCPACGAAIAKEAYLGGSIYYCPGCQK